MPVALSSSGDAEAGGLVALGASTIVVTYTDGGAIFVRRSGDSGENWDPPLQLAAYGSHPRIAGRGQAVDVVWSEGTLVRYMRSTDAGQSFSDPSVVTSVSVGAVVNPVVAHGPEGVVAVAWLEVPLDDLDCSTECFGDVNARLSHDDGESFGALAMVDSSALGSPVIAVGTNVIYVAYGGIVDEASGRAGLSVKRTVDGGESWAMSLRITRNAFEAHSIVAVGHRAYFGTSYFIDRCGRHEVAASCDDAAVHFKTWNRGANWARRRIIGPPGEDNASRGPVMLSLDGGTIRAAWTNYRYSLMGTDAFRTVYSERRTGKPWSSAEYVSEPGAYTRPAGVGFAGKTVVLYTSCQPDDFLDCRGVVQVRTRSH